jgi:hypothetical protein
MLDTIINNFWAIAAVVLGSAFAGYVAWRNSFKSRRAAACSAYRSAVLGALNGLYPHPSNWPRDGMAIDQIFRAAFPSLQLAVAEFRPFVPLWRRWHFDRAWFRYRCSTGHKIDIQCYHHYIGFTSPDEPTVDPKVTFHANVSKLLTFAKET